MDRPILVESLESRWLMASTPFTGTPAAVPGVVQAENYDAGGEGIAYHDTTSLNEGGAYRDEGVDVEPTGDAGGGYDVGYVHAGEWMNYSIKAAATGTYDLAVRVADGSQGGTFHVELDGANVTGSMTIPNTGGWQNYTTLLKNAVPISAGNHTLKVVMDTNGNYGFVGNFNWMSFTPSTGGPAAAGGTSTPFTGTPASITSTLPLANFDNGGEGVAYHDTTASNEGGVYRNEGVDLQSTADSGGGYNVGWTHAGEWLKYTVSAATSGNYDLSMRVADGAAGGTFHVEVDGNNVTGAMTVPNTGGWQNYQTISKTGIPISAGNHVIRVVMDSEGTYGFVGNFNWMQFTPSSAGGVTTTPFSGSPMSAPGTIEAENFDNGGEGVAYHSSTASNPGGAYRNTGVGIQATGDTGGGFNVGWVHAGDWMNYTINVGTAGVYTLGARVANAVQGGTFHVEFNGANLTGPMTVPSTGNWQGYTTITSPGMNLQAGTYVMRVVMDSGGPSGFVGNFNWFQLSPQATNSPPPPPSPLNVLFFGNSFTLYNNVPNLLTQLAVIEGHAAPNVYTQATYGWSLADHLNKIAADGSSNIINSLPAGMHWDDAIIQEFSTRPATVTASPVNGDPTGFRRDALTLEGLIHSNSPAAHFVLEETWARGPLNPFYPGSYASPAAMQSDILSQYNGAAYDANLAYGNGIASVANSGEGWRALGFDRSLYDGTDEYHPSPRGSLLAALILERAIYHDHTTSASAASATGLLNSLGLTASDWGVLTGVADSVE